MNEKLAFINSVLQRKIKVVHKTYCVIIVTLLVGK